MYIMYPLLLVWFETALSFLEYKSLIKLYYFNAQYTHSSQILVLHNEQCTMYIMEY